MTGRGRHVWRNGTELGEVEQVNKTPTLDDEEEKRLSSVWHRERGMGKLSGRVAIHHNLRRVFAIETRGLAMENKA